jgi:hypothetical protein
VTAIRFLARPTLALGVLLLSSSHGLAQQSAFQSGNGQTSLYLQSGGAATLNFSDTKLSLGRYFRSSGHELIVGYEIFGKASSGNATLFSSKVRVPEGGGDFAIGWHQKTDPNTPLNSSSTNDQWALVDLGYSRSAFYVSDTAVAPEKAKRYFDRFRTVAVYDKIMGRFALGAAMGAERRNNLDDLKQVTFETTVIPANGANTVVESKEGFLGNYREYIAVPVYTDVIYLVPKITAPGFKKTSIAIDGFTRSDIAATNRSTDGGLGVFVTKLGAPTKALGGIAASWNEGKGKVALVASYIF